MKECYNLITAVTFQSAQASMQAKNYQEAYNMFDKVLQRNLDPEYRQKTLALQNEAYNEVTKELYTEGESLYTQKKYRTAYNRLQEVKKRKGYVELVGNIDAHIRECRELGKVVFSFQSLQNYTDLEDFKLKIKRAVQDEFVEFTDYANTTQINRINLNFSYTYERWKGKNTPDWVEATEPLYQIKSEKRGQPEQIFYWTERVTYYAVRGTKKVNCKTTYQIDIRHWHGNKPNKIFGNNYTTSDEDALNYYARKAEFDINRLTRENISADKPVINTIQSQTELARLFLPERQTFEEEQILEYNARQAITDRLAEAIVKDLKEIIALIE
jgi:tetratricopeptide (TPR) repeat protein